jgi:predicted  nucleic acid-binding Zn-ribbon protein
MPQREDGLAQAAQIDAALAEGARREAELTDRFKVRGSEILGQIDSEKRSRAALASQLPADILARYEGLRERSPGSAVGILADGMCGACRVGLPTTKVETLLAGPDLGTCPSCGRILVVRGL